MKGYFDNGYISYSGSSTGDIATYFCNEGFVLVGNKTRVCQANSEWSGEEPICVVQGTYNNHIL